MAKALTDIKHGSVSKEGELEEHFIPTGEEVDRSLFTKEQYEALEQSGAVETEEEGPREVGSVAAGDRMSGAPLPEPEDSADETEADETGGGEGE